MWCRLGRHKITKKRPNVYYRYINRGFYRCKCPEEIKDKLSFNDLHLLYWFNNLNIEDEKKIHCQLRKKINHIGKWYKYNDIENIKNIIINNYNGIIKMPSIEEYNEAKKWCNLLNMKKYKFYKGVYCF